MNHEAWAIPYGDLITLLLAFFVVMYALSSVNEGKYRILSDSLIAAFRAPPKSLEPIQVGEIALSQYEIDTRQNRTLVPLELDSITPALDDEDSMVRDWEMLRSTGLTPLELDVAADLIDELSEALRQELQELMQENLVRLRQGRYWLEIEINTSVLFDSASAELEEDSRRVVQRVGEILAGKDTRIQVEGHTDVLPISTARFPSNWELSAARSSTVVRMFAASGVSPAQMAAVGFGEFRPAADNGTADGRRDNRRVVIVVMANRPGSEDNEWDRWREDAGPVSALQVAPAVGVGAR